MSVKFFGRFLIECGEIDAAHLGQALLLMKRENRTLGDLAVERGWLRPADVARAHAEQRRRDRPFGELAVELGLLTREQLGELVRRQGETRLRIGEALVRLGHLSPQRLAALLEAFKLDQAPFAISDEPLARALAGSRLARCTLDLLPRFCLRAAGLHVKLAAGVALGAAPALPLWVGTVAGGAHGLAIALGAERELARAIAAATARREPRTLDDAGIVDGLVEFLDALVRNAVAVIEREGARGELESVAAVPAPARGTLFALVAPDSHGALVIEAR